MLQLEPLEPRLVLSRYSLTILGPGAATAISQNGLVAGNIGRSAVEWDQNGKLTIFPEMGNANANGINQAGELVGGDLGRTGTPFICEPDGSCRDLPLLDGDHHGIAFGINDQGQAVGESGQYPFTHAVMWQDGLADGLQDLGSGTAYGVNDYGFVVGATLGGQPLMWKHGQRSTSLLGGHPGSANGINDQFQIIGLGVTPGFIWSNGTVRGIPFRPSALNNSGIVVGNDDFGGPKIWQDGTTTLLQDLVIDSKGFALGSATGIDDAGQIVGAGVRNGTVYAYRLDPAGDAPFWWAGWGMRRKVSNS